MLSECFAQYVQPLFFEFERNRLMTHWTKPSDLFHSAPNTEKNGYDFLMANAL